MEFCGRSRELNKIVSRWRLASDVKDPQPQVVILCGEAGMGKTRLAMEFFDWLKATEDSPKQGYWPAMPAYAGENIEINPDYRECSFREREIPFLWWGVRAGDIATENSVHGDAIGNYVGSLSPHLAAMTLRSRFIRKGFEDVAKDWGNFLASEIIGNASGIGPLLSFGEKVLNTAKIAAGTYQSTVKRDFAEEAERKSDTRTDAILDDLSAVLSPASKAFARKPAVILLDDAHFFMNDGALSGFAAKLTHRTISEKWPVMILVTHWRREFMQGIGPFMDVLKHARGEKVSSRFDGQPCGYLERDHFHVVELEPVAGLEKALKDEFPGLTTTQVSDLLRSAGGNPRHLAHIVMYLRKNPGLFDDFDFGGPLSERGLDTVKKKAVDLGELVADRLRNAPIEVQEAVCIASMIGMQFADKLVEAVAVRHIDWKSPHALAEAVDPYSMLRSVKDSRMLEFTDRLFYSAAVLHRRNMRNLADDDALTKTIKAVVKEQYITVTTSDDFKRVTKSRSEALERDRGGPSWRERKALWQYESVVKDIAADVFAEDDDEPEIEFACLRRKLDTREVEEDPAVWVWMSRRLLKVLGNNRSIRKELSPDEVEEFAKLFRLTGFQQEALDLLEEKLKSIRDLSDTLGYALEYAREASTYLAEAAAALSDLGRHLDARQCLRESIEAFEGIAADPTTTVELLNAVRRKATHERRHGQLEECLLDCSSWIAFLEERLPSLHMTHYRDGRVAARPQILGEASVRLSLRFFLHIALEAGSQKLLSQVCQMRIDLAEFCIRHEPDRYITASVSDSRIYRDTLFKAGYEKEADRMAQFVSRVEKAFPYKFDSTTQMSGTA